MVGNSGLIAPTEGFLLELRRLAKSQDTLLIFDEVMTGFRVHPGGAQALYGVKPDLTMLGKVIGGGLPVGAFGGRQEIMNLLAPLGPVYQAGTLSGNPLAMVAGYITLSEWLLGDLFDRTADAAARLAAELAKMAESRGIPLVAQSVGTMFGFFFHAGPIRSFTDAEKSNLARFKAFFHALLSRGVYIAPSQFESCFLSAAHLGDPIDRTLEVFEDALREVS